MIVACSPRSWLAPAATAPPQPADRVGSGLQVYFTDPQDPRAGDYSGGQDEALAAAIDRARLSVDAAVYSLNLWSVRNTLLRDRRRRVDVCMVMESDNMDSAEVQDLIAGGVLVLGDRHEGLMHDKFIIIVFAEVWSRSMNFTVGGAYKDNNDLFAFTRRRPPRTLPPVSRRCT